MVSLIYCSTPLSADSVILPLGADLQSIIDKEDKIHDMFFSLAYIVGMKLF